MKIAITGASGFLGKHLVAEALKSQHTVVAITRQDEQTFHHYFSQHHPHLSLDTLNVATCKLTDPQHLSAAIVDCDVLIHLAAVMTGDDQHQQTLNINQDILDAIDSTSIPRLILVSSLSVLDYREAPPLSRIDEGSLLCETDAALGDYARMKRDQELACRDWQQRTSRELVILRPGLIYSDDVLSDAHAGFIKKGLGLVAVHEGEVPLVHVSTVSKALLILCDNPLAKPCDTFHVIGTPAVRQKDYLLQLRRQGLLGFYLPLGWKIYGQLMEAARSLLIKLNKQNKIPDSFRSNSVAARQKPFQFAGDKMRYLLNTKKI